ncbi:MAG: dTDP-4-dehydrorhamnose 3,5-epimerase [Bacillota bacterium]|jgi:dTDP-4-dehydrorhamnose 3,5-epimerase
MGKFKFIATGIADLWVIEPTVFGDERGYFMETYQQEEFQKAGLNPVFVQDNQSRSKRGVLRGLHYQKQHPQGKLVRVIAGAVFDVAVDLRSDSITYRQWFGLVLSDDNKKQFYIPPGFAHGYLVLSELAEFVYKCTDYYHPEDEAGLLWNDPVIGVKWPLESVGEVLLSEKDRRWPGLEKNNLADLQDLLSKLSGG